MRLGSGKGPYRTISNYPTRSRGLTEECMRLQAGFGRLKRAQKRCATAVLYPDSSQRNVLDIVRWICMEKYRKSERITIVLSRLHEIVVLEAFKISGP